MSRVSKHNYYLDIAQTVAERATCLRKKFGAIIVKDDVIVSTGYNGAPRGRQNCSDLNYCMRDKLNIPRGERYELCRSVHAEANAIIAAARERMLGSTIYMVCVDAKTGELVPAGYGDGDIPRLVRMIDRDTVLTLEPHLKVFSGYNEIDGEEMKHRFRFESNDEAFDAAVAAMKKILTEMMLQRKFLRMAGQDTQLKLMVKEQKSE